MYDEYVRKARMKPSILDSRNTMKELDTDNVLGSVEMLPEQIEDAWGKTKSLHVPEEYKHVKSVVVSGMGGSELGSRVIQSLFFDSLPVPFEVVNGYHLPGYVDSETLVLLSSYSGTTEETLACGEEARKKGAKIAIITAGGELEKLAKELGCPAYIIDPVHNPSNQPRMAVGYSVFGQLGLFHAMGVIRMSDNEVGDVIALLKRNAKNLAPESTEQNAAKYLAYAAVDKMLFFVSSEHLEGSVRVFNNQVNENAKTLTLMLSLPDLNHHTMEGLGFPRHLREEVLFILFTSQLYTPRVLRRYPLTIDVAEQQEYNTESVYAVGKTKLEQVWEVIQLGAYMNFYLAMLYNINPAPIPWVDYFKKQLGA